MTKECCGDWDSNGECREYCKKTIDMEIQNKLDRSAALKQYIVEYSGAKYILSITKVERSIRSVETGEVSVVSKEFADNLIKELKQE